MAAMQCCLAPLRSLWIASSDEMTLHHPILYKEVHNSDGKREDHGAWNETSNQSPASLSNLWVAH